MKHVQKFLIAAMGLTVFGCGGTGGGIKISQPTVLNATPRLECIVAVQRTNLMHPDQWTAAQLQDPTNMDVKADLYDQTVFGAQDATNIEEGEQMIFQLAYYTTDNSGNVVRHVIPSGVTYSTSDINSTYGVLAANTGQLTVGNNATTQPLYITASYNGATYGLEYDVKIRQVRVLGQVLDENTNQPLLAGSQVQFFNSSNQLIDTVTVQFDGSIRGCVPTNTTSFTVSGDSLPSGYYRSYTYSSLRYDASKVSCFAPAPSNLLVGTTVLPSAILVSPRVQGQGTPQSTGCSGPVRKQ